MFTLRCPIPKKFINNGKVCVINQLWGENPNTTFYGPEGHTGIDFSTTGHTKYTRSDAGYTPESRDTYESNGRIPLLACHDGIVTAILNDDKQGQGWGVFVTGDVLQEEGREVQYRTLYWHIETPWASLGSFMGAIKKLLVRAQVRKGAIIAIGGNNGMSTGPHLHLSLDRREKRNGVWTAWDRINPMPYFADEEVVYQKYDVTPRWFFKGNEIKKEEAKTIINSLPPVL
jgi:hypothetical protein